MDSLGKRGRIIICILGNSLAMPVYNLELYYENTYAHKLSRDLKIVSDVVNKSQRNLTIVDQTKKTCLEDDVLSINADYYILQFGIVDCAPRLFTQRQGKLVGFVPGHKILIKFMSKHRYFFTKFFPKVYVKKEKFHKQYRFLLQTIKEKTKSKKIFAINIPHTTSKLIKRSYGIEKNIIDYNSLIKEVSQQFPDDVVLIDLFQMTKDDSTRMFDDGVHMKERTHQEISEIICENILSFECET